MVWYELASLDFVFVCRAVGLVGVSIYVLGFFALCTGRLSCSTPTYFLLTGSAASCVMVSLFVDFNLSAALIQGFYIVMSLGGAVKRWRQLGSRRLSSVEVTSTHVAASDPPTFVSERRRQASPARLQ